MIRMIVFPGGAPGGGERGGRLCEPPHGPDMRLEPSVSQPLGKVREPKAIGFDDEEDGPPVFRLIGIRCAGYACLYRRLWDAFVGGDAGRYGRVI
jgi:hypothetical protein